MTMHLELAKGTGLIYADDINFSGLHDFTNWRARADPLVGALGVLHGAE